jgi:hypothetical protein
VAGVQIEKGEVVNLQIGKRRLPTWRSGRGEYH